MRESFQLCSSPGFSVFAGLRVAILTGAVVLVGACASSPPVPTSALDAARTAITTAEKDNAGQYAAAELGDARQKLAMADKAVKNNSMIGAEQLADEALFSAGLAEVAEGIVKLLNSFRLLPKGGS